VVRRTGTLTTREWWIPLRCARRIRSFSSACYERITRGRRHCSVGPTRQAHEAARTRYGRRRKEPWPQEYMGQSNSAQKMRRSFLVSIFFVVFYFSSYNSNLNSNLILNLSSSFNSQMRSPSMGFAYLYLSNNYFYCYYYIFFITFGDLFSQFKNEILSVTNSKV
jgi:hypothetical protein